VSWRLVVAPGVAPEADALARLQAARALVPDAVLVCGRVVLPDGSLDPAAEPVPRILDKAEAIESARLGLLAVRAVRPGLLLVRTDLPAGAALAGAGSPAAALAASAALLRDDRGVLAPLAVGQRAAPGPVESTREHLRILRSPAWTREERLLQLFALTRRGQ
jgi:hypothetical protein